MYYFRFQAGLRKFTLSTTFALKSCDFRAEAAKVYFVYYFCDECSENSPAKVPRWGPRKFFFLAKMAVSGTRNFRQPSYIYIYIPEASFVT